MKAEWLIANVTPARSPDRAERVLLRMILGVYWTIQRVFWPILAIFVAGSNFVMWYPLLIPNTCT